jgi:hypothetical protein
MRLKYHNPLKSRDYLLPHNILDAILGRFVRYAYTIHWCAMCRPRAGQHDHPILNSRSRHAKGDRDADAHRPEVAEGELLDVLVTLVKAYERKHFPLDLPV